MDALATQEVKQDELKKISSLGQTREEVARRIVEKTLLLAKMLPYSTLREVEFRDPKPGGMNTWMVEMPIKAGKSGELGRPNKLVIFRNTLEKWPLIVLPALSAHESGHTCFTFFWASGEFINDKLLAMLSNIMEDGRINRCLHQNYPATLDGFKTLQGLTTKISTTPIEHPDIEDLSKRKQVEWLDRAQQLMIAENHVPGAGKLLMTEPGWCRDNHERIFLTQAMDYYYAYVGVEPMPVWSHSYNKALNAKSMTHLFAFDRYCGELFSLPPRAIPPKEEVLHKLKLANQLLPQALDRLTRPGVAQCQTLAEAATDEDRLMFEKRENLKKALETAGTEIEAGTLSHANYGVCLAVIGLANDTSGIVLHRRKELSFEDGRAHLDAMINERLLTPNLSMEETRCFEDLRIMAAQGNADKISAWVRDRRKENEEVERKARRDKIAPVRDTRKDQRVLDAASSFVQIADRLSVKRSFVLDSITPKQEQSSGGGGGGGGGGSSEEQEQEQGQSGGEGNQQSCSEPGIGHDSEGTTKVEYNMPDTRKGCEAITPSQLPYWIDSGNVPRKNEPEVMIRKNKSPGQSSGSNGTMTLSLEQVHKYRDMIWKEFLCARIPEGRTYTVEVTSRSLGDLDPDDFILNDITSGAQAKDMFRSTEEYEDADVFRKGEELAPELIVLLDDFSGSMHECARELGAFSAAAHDLCRAKETRLLLALGSSEGAVYDSWDPAQFVMGEAGIIDTIEERFNLDNGGNSPTWHPDTVEKVNQVLAEYSSRPHKVKVIVGSDEHILGQELEWLAMIKAKYPTTVVSEKPSLHIIQELGKFLRSPDIKEVEHIKGDGQGLDMDV